MNITVGAYRALLVLYPRRFRRDYAEDMVLMFAQQLRDESAWRVCSRAATDLALSVPTRYLELVMKTTTSPFLSTLFAALAVAGLVFAIAAGTNPGFALSGGAIGVIAAGLAVASYRRNRPLTTPASANGWWKVGTTGAALFAALIVTVNVTGEVDDGWWFPMVITGLTAIVLMAIGLILGVAHFVGDARRAPVA